MNVLNENYQLEKLIRHPMGEELIFNYHFELRSIKYNLTKTLDQVSDAVAKTMSANARLLADRFHVAMSFLNFVGTSSRNSQSRPDNIAFCGVYGYSKEMREQYERTFS